MPHVLHAGKIELSPNRRLLVTLRDERPDGAVVDVRVQVQTADGWVRTPMLVTVPAEHLHELVRVLETATERLAEL